MTDTHDYFRQISELLDNGQERSAWNLFRRSLREAHESGYDMGNEDATNEEPTT